jgi:hypothetical protein
MSIAIELGAYERIEIPAAQCAKVGDLRKRLPSQTISLEGSRYAVPTTHLVLTLGDEPLHDSTLLSSLSADVIRCRLPEYRVFDLVLGSHVVRQAFPADATVLAVRRWIARHFLIDIHSVSLPGLSDSDLLPERRLAFAVDTYHPITVSYSGRPLLLFYLPGITGHELRALIQAPGPLSLLVDGRPLDLSISITDLSVAEAVPRGPWPNPATDYSVEFPNGDVRLRSFPQSATSAFIRAALAREFAVPYDRLELAYTDGTPLALNGVPIRPILVVKCPTIEVLFDSGQRVSLPLVAQVVDLKVALASRLQAPIWRIRLHVRATLLDDEWPVADLGVDDGVTVSSSLDGAHVRVYVRYNEDRLIYDCHPDDTLEVIAAKFARYLSCVKFKDRGYDIPRTTKVASLPLQPRTPLEVSVGPLLVPIIRGQLRRLGRVDRATARSIASLFTGTFVLVQNGRVLRDADKELTDLKSPVYVRDVPTLLQEGFLFVFDGGSRLLSIDPPTVGTAKRRLNEELQISDVDIGGFADDQGLDPSVEYHVSSCDLVFAVELECGRVFHTDRSVFHPSSLSPDALVRKLCRDIDAAPTSFSVDGQRVQVRFGPPLCLCRYTFMMGRRSIGVVSTAPSTRVDDVKARLLETLGIARHLPGCLRLCFWDGELGSGESLGDGGVPSGAHVEVLEGTSREFIVDGISYWAGQADTVAGLKAVVAKEKKVSAWDFLVLLGGREVGDEELLWALPANGIQCPLREMKLMFNSGEKGATVTVTVPLNATFEQLQARLAQLLEVDAEKVSFASHDEVIRDATSHVLSFRSDLRVLVEE